MRITRFFRSIVASLFVLLTVSLSAQTFRGGIAGTILDSTGAVVPHAKITLLGQDTGMNRETESTGDGTYSFQDLPLGKYTVTITAAGFSDTKITDIATRPGEVYALSP
ncbi:carboxypeptidase-like regulatory domain-containing protein, partial [Terriglobus sp. YAF25]